MAAILHLGYEDLNIACSVPEATAKINQAHVLDERFISFKTLSGGSVAVRVEQISHISEPAESPDA